MLVLSRNSGQRVVLTLASGEEIWVGVGHVKDLLWWLSQLEHDLPAPRQADFPDEQQHIAAADCWQYRCGLIEGLRKSLREELEMIRENL